MNTDRSQIEALGHPRYDLYDYDYLISRVQNFVSRVWGGQPDPKIRAYRALEELLELCQVLEITPEKCHELVDYTYGRPVGELNQELGGVSFTIAALYGSLDKNFILAGFEAVDEAEGRIDQIRAKSKVKPHVV